MRQASRRKAARIARATLASLIVCGATNAQTIELVSVDQIGTIGDDDCYGTPAISADGRYVAFNSYSTNLVAGVTQTGHVYLRDCVAGTIEIATVAAPGFSMSGEAFVGGLSDDGNRCAFRADRLLDNDFAKDIYVRDRAAGTTAELTLFDFHPPQYDVPSISGDGTLLAWSSSITLADIYSKVEVHRVGTGFVASQSGTITSSGSPSDSFVSQGVLSRDGRFVVYRRSTIGQSQIWRWEFEAPGSSEVLVDTAIAGASVDVGAVSGDGRYVVVSRTLASGVHETWLKDLMTGAQERVDVPISGSLAYPSKVGGISDDGRYVAFTSWVDNLVAGDTNATGDAFVRDRLTQQTARVSCSAAGAQANGGTNAVALAPNGQVIALLSYASNLVAGDTNGSQDVFRRGMCEHYYFDADGDGYGAGAALFTCELPPTGYVALGGDCDDGDATRNPGATEACNGIDEDCDGQVDDGISGSAYCQSTPSTQGCVARVTTVGCPSAAQASGFAVRVDQVDGQRSVAMFYGASQAAIPFTPPNTMCVAAPRQRLPIASSGGTSGACDGSVTLDFLAWAAAHPGSLLTPLAAGQQVCFQAWFRDPASSAGFRLSDAWSTTMLP